MKKVFAILLAILMLTAIAACGDSTPKTSDTGATNTGGTNTGGTNTGGVTPSVVPPSSGTGDVGVAEIEMIDPVDLILWPGDLLTVPEGAQLDDKIVCSLELSINILDPQSSASTVTACRIVMQMVYDRLTYFDPVAQTTNPELATGWDTDDQIVWTFYLREGVKFHNGDNFTAQDVVDTWESAMSPEAMGSLANDNWGYVESMRIINDYTVEMTLRAPYASFAYNLAMPGGAIVNKRARMEDPVEGVRVGTGPFYISDFLSGNSLTVSRFDDYWGNKALVKDVEFIFVPEMATRSFMQINGETDMVMSVPAADNDLFLQSPDHYLYTYAANSTHCLTMNLLHPITGDINFRRAVAAAIDREEIALAAKGRWAKINNDGAFWGDSTPFRNTSIPPLVQDLDKAREYLEASSYNGEVLTIITAPDTLTIASQALQQQLRVVGINTEILTADVPTLVSMTGYGNPEYSFVFFVCAYELDASSARLFLLPNMRSNRANFENDEIIDILNKVIAIGDENEQRRMYYRIQELVAETIPQISIFENLWTFITNSRVGGVKVNPDMNHDLRGVFKLAG